MDIIAAYLPVLLLLALGFALGWFLGGRHARDMEYLKHLDSPFPHLKGFGIDAQESQARWKDGQRWNQDK